MSVSSQNLRHTHQIQDQHWLGSLQLLTSSTCIQRSTSSFSLVLSRTSSVVTLTFTFLYQLSTVLASSLVLFSLGTLITWLFVLRGKLVSFCRQRSKHESAPLTIVSTFLTSSSLELLSLLCTFQGLLRLSISEWLVINLASIFSSGPIHQGCA